MALLPVVSDKSSNRSVYLVMRCSLPMPARGDKIQTKRKYLSLEYNHLLWTLAMSAGR